MNILIDTHIALWVIANRSKLPKDIIDSLEDLDNKVYVSLASVWEVTIKNIKNKKTMPMNENDFVKYCSKMEFEFLPIKIRHIMNLRNLEIKDDKLIHKDPFDKIIISQCDFENMTLYTSDAAFSNYKIQNIKII